MMLKCHSIVLLPNAVLWKIGRIASEEVNVEKM